MITQGIGLTLLHKYFINKNEVVVTYLFGSIVTGREGLKKILTLQY